jgi:hypothetical protein
MNHDSGPRGCCRNECHMSMRFFPSNWPADPVPSAHRIMVGRGGSTGPKAPCSPSPRTVLPHPHCPLPGLGCLRPHCSSPVWPCLQGSMVLVMLRVTRCSTTGVSAWFMICSLLRNNILHEPHTHSAPVIPHFGVVCVFWIRARRPYSRGSPRSS